MECFRKDSQGKFYYNTVNAAEAEWSQLVSRFGTVLANDEIVNGVSERAVYGGT
jgi:hypothetical protein